MKCKKTTTKYVLAAAACAVSLDPRAYATNYTYVGPNNGSFITDGTSPWSPASFPSSGDNVYVGLAEPADDSMTVNFNYGSGSFFYPDGGFSLVNIDPPNSSVMQIAEGPTAGGEATLETASLNISYNGSWVQGGTGETQNTVTGSLTLAGEYSLLRGSLSVGSLLFSLSSEAEFSQSGGTFTAGQIGIYDGNYYLSAGSVSTSSLLLAAIPSTSEFDQTGGTITVGSSSSSGILDVFFDNLYSISNVDARSALILYGTLDIGDNAGGKFQQSGGSTTITGAVTLASGGPGQGEVTLSGGTMSVGGDIDVGSNPQTATTYTGTGTATFSGAIISAGGTLRIQNTSSNVTLSAGSLTVLGITDDDDPSLFDWTGGTLHLTGQILDFTSATDGNATFGQSLQISSSQTLIADDGENLLDNATGIAQNGNNSTSSLLVANKTSGSGYAVYQLNSGTLSASYELLGAPTTSASGEGALDQYGGTNTVGHLTIGTYNSGTYSATGGTLSVTDTLQVGDEGLLDCNGGSITSALTENYGQILITSGLTQLGPVTGVGTLSVGYPIGSGVSVTVNSITQGVVSIASTGRLTISTNNTAVTNTVARLAISGNGTLDLTNNKLIISYASGIDPIASIAALIDSGYAGGSWTGTGIASTTAEGNAGSYGIGYADSADPGNPAGLSSGQIEIMYTLLGDANLDGKVNGADFILMAANFNKTVTNGWDEGDFNYDGKVNGDDFVLLADNFNQFASQSAVSAADFSVLNSFASANGISLTSVPEPTSFTAVALACLGALACRSSTKKISSRTV